MRTTSLVLLFVCGMAAFAADRRTGSLLVFNGTFGDAGVALHVDMVSEPPGYKEGPSGYTTEAGGIFHHYVVNDSRVAYFGYDVKMEQVPGTSKIRVLIEPLSLTAEKLNEMSARSADKPDFSRLRVLVLPKYPPPQIIEAGDTIALDLLVSPDGKQKVVDYLTFTLKK
ncbi:MAG TPA: hypothetical protein VMJ34_22545 [Bryobacteraceae bacterium]|nr:hypothetical protein [Bryobacteraceae bacterium]